MHRMPAKWLHHVCTMCRTCVHGACMQQRRVIRLARRFRPGAAASAPSSGWAERTATWSHARGFGATGWWCGAQQGHAEARAMTCVKVTLAWYACAVFTAAQLQAFKRWAAHVSTEAAAIKQSSHRNMLQLACRKRCRALRLPFRGHSIPSERRLPRSVFANLVIGGARTPRHVLRGCCRLAAGCTICSHRWLPGPQPSQWPFWLKVARKLGPRHGKPS